MAKGQLAVNTGLGKVRYSIIGEGGTFGVPKVLNDLVSFAVNPSESNQKLFAGDRAIIVDNTLSVSGTIGVPAVSNSAMCDLFGYTLTSKGELLYSSKAVRPNVVLMIEQNNYGGVVDHITLWDCKLNLSQTQGNTKSDNISYGTKELAFEALIPEDGVYMSIQSSDEEGFVAPDYKVAPVKPTVA